jgi:hypothetical protein
MVGRGTSFCATALATSLAVFHVGLDPRVRGEKLESNLLVSVTLLNTKFHYENRTDVGFKIIEIYYFRELQYLLDRVFILGSWCRLAISLVIEACRWTWVVPTKGIAVDVDGCRWM